MSASVATFGCPHIGNSNTVQQVKPDVLLGLSAVGGLFSKEGCEVSIKELDTLLSLLAEKKRKMEQVQSDHFKHFFAPELGFQWKYEHYLLPLR